MTWTIDQLACFENISTFFVRFEILCSHNLVNIEHKLNVRKNEIAQQIVFSDIYNYNANDFDLKITENNMNEALILKEGKIVLLLQWNKTTTATQRVANGNSFVFIGVLKSAKDNLITPALLNE